MCANFQNASLVVVGSGIKSLSHMTLEAKTYIKQSKKVLYLVNEPVMKQWIQENNPNTESLDHLYVKFPMRIDCYHAITDYILDVLRAGCHVCVVIYGHPCAFAQPGLDAVIQAKKEGYDARVFPGISADACLFADLVINPADCGVQSFEATDFLANRRAFSVCSHLLLWQVGAIGQLGHERNTQDRKGVTLLQQYLRGVYPAGYIVVLYEAAQYPHVSPKIIEYRLDQLHHADFSRLSTLYVAPVKKAAPDKAMMKALKLTRV